MKEDKLKIFSQCADSSVDSIAIGNRDRRIIYVNDAFVRMFGYSREELIGKEIAFIYPEEEIPKLEKALKTTLEGSWKGELIGKRKDGGLFPMAISASSAVDDKGNVIAHMAYHRDITEQKRAEEEIEKKVLRSERLATIGEFSSGVAHELRQPLSVINNAAYFLGIMLKDIADEKVKQYLGILEKEVKRANRMINDLLDFARVPMPTLTKCVVNQVVEEARSEVDIPANIELKKELKEDITAIHADFDQIQRMCMNIITNAISVMPEGGSLGIKTKENKEEGNIEIIISDTGEGISGE